MTSKPTFDPRFTLLTLQIISVLTEKKTRSISEKEVLALKQNCKNTLQHHRETLKFPTVALSDVIEGSIKIVCLFKTSKSNAETPDLSPAGGQALKVSGLQCETKTLQRLLQPEELRATSHTREAQTDDSEGEDCLPEPAWSFQDLPLLSVCPC